MTHGFDDMIMNIEKSCFSGMMFDTGTTVNPNLEYFKDRYIVQDVPYNGDCMFSCLAAGLNGPFTSDRAHNVRQEIVTFLHENREMVSVFF